MNTKRIRPLFALLLFVSCYCFVNGCKKGGGPETNTTTVPPAEELKVVADSVGGVGQNVAVFSGKITQAVSTVTDRGVVYGLSASPAENKTVASTFRNNGTFDVALEKLTPSTTYYIRGYATNSKGTVYTNDLQFATKAPPAAQAQVTTDPTFVTGATTAFVAGTAQLINGSFKETGMCIGRTATPTIQDRKITSPGGADAKFLLRINGLDASTSYYIRAFGTDDKGVTYYGNNVTLSTIAKGNITWRMNWEDPNADDATKAAYGRIKTAFNQAVELMNNFTAISKQLVVNYSPGTPTADANIDGWINVGANPGYQRTGTALHEINHAIGVGTHWRWPQLMVNGIWQEYNANKNLQFLTQNPAAKVHGDRSHFWPFGVNGSWEDTGAEMDYIITCLIMQGMKADGLPSAR